LGIREAVSHFRELAILGARPAFDEPVRFGVPNDFDQTTFHELVGQVLETRRFTNDGPIVRSFEDRICEIVDAKHCVAVSNATVGLQLLMMTEVPGRRFSVPAFTFPATFEAIRAVGHRPIFIDVDPFTYNIDPSKIEPTCRGVVATHLWGRICPVDDIRKACKNLNYYDAAHAFGRRSGVYGDAEVFSFHATKFVSCGEGGAIVTDDEELARTMRRLRNFGYGDGTVVVAHGTNAKMPELSACLGHAYLDVMDSIIEHNRENYLEYSKNITNPYIKLVSMGDYHPNYQYIVLDIPEEMRDLVWLALSKENVETKRYFHPGAQLPEAERLWRRTLCLPTGTSVSQSKVRRICELLDGIVGAYIDGCLEGFKGCKCRIE
jgi:dTDP-4-amino-4,6-dideoxyglucose